jgi:hypothetical protein
MDPDESEDGDEPMPAAPAVGAVGAKASVWTEAEDLELIRLQARLPSKAEAFRQFHDKVCHPSRWLRTAPDSRKSC